MTASIGRCCRRGCKVLTLFAIGTASGGSVLVLAVIPNGCGCSSGVEHDLAKVGVEGSNPFARSNFLRMSAIFGAAPQGASAQCVIAANLNAGRLACRFNYFGRRSLSALPPLDLLPKLELERASIAETFGAWKLPAPPLN
jgi:hypothetical protein